MQKQKLLVNNKQYEWDLQFITGIEIRQLANISLEKDLYLDKGGKDDQLITDDFKVDLSKPGVEKVATKQKPEKVIIIVNGRNKPWPKRSIMFEEVVILAFGTYDKNPDIVYTVTYDMGPKENPEGTMVPGDTVFVKHKMVFNVTQTNKS